jgi:MFS family permease
MPAWFALLLLLPSGMSSGLALVALPYLLTQRGVSVERIGASLALALLPYTWKVLLGPMVDLGARRRTWFVVMTGLGAGAVALLGALMQRRVHGLSLDGLLVLATLSGAIADSAAGSLCATLVPTELRGRASSFYAVGQTLWTGLLGSLILFLYEPPALLQAIFPALVHGLPLAAITLGAALCMLGVAVLALVLDEPARPRGPRTEQLRAVAQDAWLLLRTPAGWIGFLLCVMPLGSGALANLQGALATEYGASPQSVALIGGVGTTALSVLGSLLGGALADRTGPRLAYLGLSAVQGVFSLVLALLPATPFLYGFGCLSYGLLSGACYSAFYTYIFDLIGKRTATTTAIGLYCGAGSMAVAYMTLVEGRMHALGGRVALLVTDGASSLLAVLLCAAVLYGGRALWVRTPRQECEY